MTIQDHIKNLHLAATLISQADGLLITAGAGMGIDSGLPDFRGEKGFWKAYPALGRRHIKFHDIATPSAFLEMPAQTWGFYGHRLELYRQTIPHQGFQLLKKWGESMRGGYSVFTSNVDEQFQKAGFTPYRIHECHGSIHRLQCSDACTNTTWDAACFIPQVDLESGQLTNAPPVCPACGAIARPNALLFNDSYWLESESAIQKQRQQVWIDSITKPVIIEIGAGLAISTVRNFSDRIARQFNGHLIRINPTHPNVSRSVDVSLSICALEALQEIDAILDNKRSGQSG